MPIIAVTPPVTPPSTSDAVWVDSRMLALATIDDSDEQEFVTDEWVIMPGMTGMGLPPVDVITQQTPGMDGAWLREVRVGPREVFLPILAASNTSHVDYLAMLDRLQGFLDARAVADVTAVDGSCQLIARSAWGERRLTTVYLDGMQGDEGQDRAGSYWSTFGVRLLAADPWWRAAEETVLEFKVGSGDPFLATAASGDVWPRKLAPSVSAGADMPITVGGRVPVWPTIEVVGPATTVTVTTDAGMAVDVGAVIGGETLTLVTDPRRRSARVNGTPAWARVAAGPRFARLSAGSNTISVAVPGATSATRVRLRWHVGWRTAW